MAQTPAYDLREHTVCGDTPAEESCIGATNMYVYLQDDLTFERCYRDPYAGNLAILFKQFEKLVELGHVTQDQFEAVRGPMEAVIENLKASKETITLYDLCSRPATDFSEPLFAALGTLARYDVHLPFLGKLQGQIDLWRPVLDNFLAKAGQYTLRQLYEKSKSEVSEATVTAVTEARRSTIILSCKSGMKWENGGCVPGHPTDCCVLASTPGLETEPSIISSAEGWHTYSD